jgi:hypothetical protein
MPEGARSLQVIAERPSLRALWIRHWVQAKLASQRGELVRDRRHLTGCDPVDQVIIGGVHIGEFGRQLGLADPAMRCTVGTVTVGPVASAAASPARSPRAVKLVLRAGTFQTCGAHRGTTAGPASPVLTGSPGGSVVRHLFVRESAGQFLSTTCAAGQRNLNSGSPDQSVNVRKSPYGEGVCQALAGIARRPASQGQSRTATVCP